MTFEISVFEATVGKFRQFLRKTSYQIPEWLSGRMPPERDAYPTSSVSWDDAEPFAISASIRERRVCCRRS
jgi:formylglycine-generating enzyme required for sulfatase activity